RASRLLARARVGEIDGELDLLAAALLLRSRLLDLAETAVLLQRGLDLVDLAVGVGGAAQADAGGVQIDVFERRHRVIRQMREKLRQDVGCGDAGNAGSLRPPARQGGN